MSAFRVRIHPVLLNDNALRSRIDVRSHLGENKAMFTQIESYGLCQNIVTIASTVTNKVHSTIYEGVQ